MLAAHRIAGRVARLSLRQLRYASTEVRASKGCSEDGIWSFRAVTFATSAVPLAEKAPLWARAHLAPDHMESCCSVGQTAFTAQVVVCGAGLAGATSCTSSSDSDFPV